MAKDAPQQARVLRHSKTARAVRRTFGEGTRVEGNVGGQRGTVTRHVPSLNAQGGTLVIAWDNGRTGRTSACSVHVLEEA